MFPISNFITWLQIPGANNAQTRYSPDAFVRLLKSSAPIPENCHVTGGLDLGTCKTEALARLPKGLHVEGGLYLIDCTGLTSLPEGLHVEGSLALSGCTGLTSLPEGLHVGGDLRLIGCRGLTSLPEGVHVRGHLYLTGCTGLTSLPEGLHVEGDLDLTGCRGLTSLPNWITTLGPCADGDIRHIYLERTGLSAAILDRLREVNVAGVQFFYGHAPTAPACTFSTVEEAIGFWKNRVNDVRAAPKLVIPREMDSFQFCQFLARLTTTADYMNLQTRAILARRVLDVVSTMAANDELCIAACTLIHEGLSSCDDRIISALQEIELLFMLYEIERTSPSEQELRKLGKSFLLLQMVHEQANAHKTTLAWVDEIEIYLAFELALAERLALPVNSKNMIFRRCAQISDKKLRAIGDAIEKACTKEAQEAFLATWSPWIAYKRKQKPVIAYADIPTTDRLCEDSDICPITQERPTQPVFLDGCVYDYDALVQCFRKTGRHPISQETLDLSRLTRPVDMHNLKLNN